MFDCIGIGKIELKAPEKMVEYIKTHPVDDKVNFKRLAFLLYAYIDSGMMSLDDAVELLGVNRDKLISFYSEYGLMVDYEILTVNQIKEQIEPICKEYDINQAYLFGSYSRGEADAKSDIDIRIEFERNNPKLHSLLQVCAFENSLKDVLKKDVQVITKLPDADDKLNAIFRENLLNDEVLIYEKQ